MEKIKTIKLNKGQVDLYTANGINLYAYKTNDPMDDEVFVAVKNDRGVVIEMPCFFDNIRELNDFLQQEGI